MNEIFSRLWYNKNGGFIMEFGIKSIKFSNFKKFDRGVELKFSTDPGLYNYKYSTILFNEGNENEVALNSTIGIIGANSSGKSTCIELFAKYFDFNRLGSRYYVDNFGLREEKNVFFQSDFTKVNLHIKVTYTSLIGDFVHELTFKNPLEYDEKITLGKEVLWDQKANTKNSWSFGWYYQFVKSGRIPNQETDKLLNKELLYFGECLIDISTNQFKFYANSEKGNLLNHMSVEFATEVQKNGSKSDHSELMKKVEFILKTTDDKIKSVSWEWKEKFDFSGRPIKVQEPIIKLQNNKTIPFDQLSNGTIKFLNTVLVALRLANNEGRAHYIFIDELDNSWHPNLTTFLIRLFKTEFFKNVILVFTAHNPYVMEEVRKDALFLIDENGINPFNELKWNDKPIRNDFKFAKNYYDEVIGSHPSEIQLEQFSESDWLYGN
jgi:hypothetical protein